MTDLPFAVGAERSPLHAGLLVGDVAIVVLVLSAGMVRHGESPLGVPGRAALVIGPFVASWLAVSYLLGAYTGDARRSVVAAMGNTGGTWAATAAVGAGLRATAYLPGNSPPTFVAVVAGTGAVALAAWRGVVTAVVGPAGR